MEKHLEITRQRLRTLLRPEQLPSKLYPIRASVKLALWRAPSRVAYCVAAQAKYRPVKLGEKLGPHWATHWFKVDIAVPREWRGREVHFLWDSSSEACIWIGDVPIQGLSGTGVASYEIPLRPVREHFLLKKRARGGERISLHVETACNHFGGVIEPPLEMGTLRRAEIAVFDREAWDLLRDYTIITDMAEHVPRPSTRGAQALWVANEMLNACDLDDRSSWPKVRRLARSFLAAQNGSGQHNISAIGHAHIDTAWLWPLAETKRKCYRTFSTALETMKWYPDFKFACSQAQQFEWIKQEQPALYQKIKRRVKTGSFVPVGGTWIEPDCNIPSGESLVRQFLIGQRFFQKEFGIRCSEFWNPDVFGYNAQLPQIMHGVGIRRFLTQKLSWNQFNKPDSHTFWWEGLDGSRVLTHFPPADNYSSYGTVREMIYLLTHHKDLERINESIFLFGYGDGGGGPTWDMLENLQRMGNLDGLPKVALRTPREFFDRLEDGMKPLTTQTGELYLEMHRGTYTTQAKTKLLNRRSEELLHDVEFLFAVTKAVYPVIQLQRLWKLVLLNQFHDIIPGSSITEVHQESEAQYTEVLRKATKLREVGIRRIERRAAESSKNAKPSSTSSRILTINTLGFSRREVVEVGGKPVIVGAPSMGFAVQEATESTEHPVTVKASTSGFVMENQFIRATFRRDGHLKSLVNRQTGGELIDGQGNHFVIFDDVPLAFEAWDVDIFHLEKRREVAGAAASRIVSSHPLRAALEFIYDLTPASKLRLQVSLDAISPRLEFACFVKWSESRKFLKVEFPTSVRSTEATFEIQFGHVSRPTAFNNTFDVARFEVCAHRWADLSQSGKGLALLNDCKYGHAVQGGIMRLSLLRSPKHPDPVADIGQHHFRYALIPHAGDFRRSGIIPAARAFNSPLVTRKTSTSIQESSFLNCNDPALVIDTVKRAEDSKALVVRLYEAHGAQGRATLHLNRKFAFAYRCNLLEEEDRPLNFRGTSLTIPYFPHEIITLKFR